MLMDIAITVVCCYFSFSIVVIENVKMSSQRKAAHICSWMRLVTFHATQSFVMSNQAGFGIL